MILHPSPVSTRSFYYDSATQTFTAELSGLGKDFCFGRVWDDSCDVGLTLVSSKTGREVVFAIEEERRDRDGDLSCIVLIPANRKSPWVIHLFND